MDQFIPVCSRANDPDFLLVQQEESGVGGLSGGNGQLWTLGIGLLVTAFAATYVTRLAKVTLLNCDLWLKIRIQTLPKLQIRHYTRMIGSLMDPDTSDTCVCIVMQDAVKDIE